MVARTAGLAIVLTACFLPEALAFRNCAAEDSSAYAAATQYLVGELEFDAETASASGTQTIYNFANYYGEQGGECHVTYEFSGSYNPGSEIFVLSGDRSNYSPGCPQSLIEHSYPQQLNFDLQMRFNTDGSSLVQLADNGEVLANGSWSNGRTVYKTGEDCTLF